MSFIKGKCEDFLSCPHYSLKICNNHSKCETVKGKYGNKDPGGPGIFKEDLAKGRIDRLGVSNKEGKRCGGKCHDQTCIYRSWICSCNCTCVKDCDYDNTCYLKFVSFDETSRIFTLRDGTGNVFNIPISDTHSYECKQQKRKSKKSRKRS